MVSSKPNLGGGGYVLRCVSLRVGFVCTWYICMCYPVCVLPNGRIFLFCIGDPDDTIIFCSFCWIYILRMIVYPCWKDQANLYMRVCKWYHTGRRWSTCFYHEWPARIHVDRAGVLLCIGTTRYRYYFISGCGRIRHVVSVWVTYVYGEMTWYEWVCLEYCMRGLLESTKTPAIRSLIAVRSEHVLQLLYNIAASEAREGWVLGVCKQARTH